MITVLPPQAGRDRQREMGCCQAAGWGHRRGGRRAGGRRHLRRDGGRVVARFGGPRRGRGRLGRHAGRCHGPLRRRGSRMAAHRGRRGWTGGGARCGVPHALGVFAHREKPRGGCSRPRFDAGPRCPRFRCSSTPSRMPWQRFMPGQETCFSEIGIRRHWARCAMSWRRGMLVERTAFPVGTTVDQARTAFSREMFKAYLAQVDGSGAARPRYEWAPGKDSSPPIPAASDVCRVGGSRMAVRACPRGVRWCSAGSCSRPRTVPRRHAADSRRGGGIVRSARGRGRRGRQSGRRATPAGQRRYRHLRRQPEHQLHQPVLLPMWFLRVLQGAPGR